MKRNIPKSKRYKPPKPEPPKVYRWVATRTGRLGLEVEHE